MTYDLKLVPFKDLRPKTKDLPSFFKDLRPKTSTFLRTYDLKLVPF